MVYQTAGEKDSAQQRHNPAFTVLSPDQTSVEFELMIRHPTAYPVLAPLDHHVQVTRGASTETSKRQSLSAEIYVDPTLDRAGQPDSRFSKVQFAQWTDVPVSGLEAALALTRYFEVDHPLLNLFDPELFIQSLNQGDQAHCSGLLVDALLGWSLVSCSRSIVPILHDDI